MKRIMAFTVLVVLLGCLAAVVLLDRRHSQGPAVQISLRVSVEPPAQTESVIQHARSAKFKYLVGEGSGVKPIFAQRLELKATGSNSQIEARIAVETEEQARRYIQAFMQTLEWRWGKQARLKLIEQSVR